MKPLKESKHPELFHMSELDYWTAKAAENKVCINVKTTKMQEIFNFLSYLFFTLYSMWSVFWLFRATVAERPVCCVGVSCENKLFTGHTIP